MAELLEYALVVLTSTLVVGFSVVSYSGYTSSVDSAARRAALSSYVALAFGAVEHGGSSASLALDDASLSCDSGTLTFRSGSLTGGAMLPADCHFSYPGVTGTHKLTFVYSSGVLSLEVK